MNPELVETWHIHQRIMLYFLDALSDEQLSARAAKGKSVRGQLAHVHNVRLMWLKSAAPRLLEPLGKLDDETPRDALRSALLESGKAIESLVEQSAGRVKGFKPHTSAFVAYLVAHESSHRGQAELILRLEGMPLDDSVGYGIWQWGVR
jgi:uncharacterized damage-inducible protein DinB